ncbi:VIT domain-containing protein [Roseovarius sp.]|uniref:VIT domain-containing protein n=1 Tax=Roseovarius sp. TaxID=1486281 RepID=UPI00356A1D47
MHPIGLHPLGDARIVLEQVSAEAVLEELLVTVTLQQHYRNEEAFPIEAVYTFPLPLDAVLLELSFEHAGRDWKGTVRPRADAQAAYEEAVDDGDTAVLLEQVGPGLYTMDVGNLLAGEEARVRLRYLQLLRWQGDTVRFHLPTTIAPRYGDPSAAGLAPHEQPTYTLSDDVRLNLAVTLREPWLQAAFDCPSHAVTITESAGQRLLQLASGPVPMDRDFVLTLRAPQHEESRALVGQDGQGVVVSASFHPRLPGFVRATPRSLQILVDCSGSMTGDSITQARSALGEILPLLRQHDSFNIIAFGSHQTSLFPHPTLAEPEAMAAAWRFIERLDADHGGTELQAALDLAFQGSQRCEGAVGDILLITDGEVWDDGSILEAVTHSGHRVFVVGVGSAVAEPLLAQSAAISGGAVEFVSPLENMSERIVRQFMRMDQPRAEEVAIHWSASALWQAPSRLENFFAGDTMHVFGHFEGNPPETVGLDVRFTDGSRFHDETRCDRTRQSAQSANADDLARIAAFHRLAELLDSDAKDLAVQYQLLTANTAYVLIEQRADAQTPAALPALRVVPHTMPAGWGGLGSSAASERVAPARHIHGASDYAGSEMHSYGPASGSEGVARSMRLGDADFNFDISQSHGPHSLRALLTRLEREVEMQDESPDAPPLDLEFWLEILGAYSLAVLIRIALRAENADGSPRYPLALGFLAAYLESPANIRVEPDTRLMRATLWTDRPEWTELISENLERFSGLPWPNQ